MSADDEERAEDHRVFGLGLDADAVRALDVAAPDRPDDADEEDDAGEVGAERVRLVHAAVQELQDSGSWWSISSITVAMNRHEEAEVDEGVHDPGGGVAQQRLHPDAGAEVARGGACTLLLRGAPVVGRAALVVPDPQRHEPRAR